MNFTWPNWASFLFFRTTFGTTFRGAIGVSLLLSGSVLADHHKSEGSEAATGLNVWALDDAGSEVSFVTVKAGDIAEAHTLSKLSGGVNIGQGQSAEVNVVVHLDSVDTGIPIRNERMLEFLFEVARFPLAKIHGHLPAAHFVDVPVGSSKSASLPLMLDLHGERISVTAEVLALRIADDRFMVTSTKPIIVNASSVGLVAGIDKLQQLASLPSISKAVPVSFVLTFVR